MLKPFYMLEGEIQQIKRVDYGNLLTEITYEDENGDRAVIARIRKQREN